MLIYVFGLLELESVEIEIGANLKEIILALVALLGTVAGYYFGYKRGVSNSIPDKVKDKSSKED